MAQAAEQMEVSPEQARRDRRNARRRERAAERRAERLAAAADEAVANPREMAPVKSLDATTVIIRLDFGMPGESRKIDSANIDVDADKEIVKARKKLFDGCDEFKNIRRAMADAKRYVASRAVPSSALKGGYKRIPVSLVESTDSELASRWEAMQELIDKFLEAYPGIIDTARARLRSLFEEADFPPAIVIRDRFKMSWSYHTMETPDTLKTVSDAMFKREEEKAAAAVVAEVDEIRNGLRQGMSEIVDRMVERLTPDTDGKPKVFRNTLVENMREFMEIFEARNVTEDTELAAVVARARTLLAGGTDAETLRRDDSVRETILEGMSKVKDSLDGMVVKATRKLDLD